MPRGHLEKKWSEKEEPGGERSLTAWMEGASGTTSIRAVLQACRNKKQLHVFVKIGCAFSEHVQDHWLGTWWMWHEQQQQATPWVQSMLTKDTRVAHTTM